jgi:hypothetical protein
MKQKHGDSAHVNWTASAAAISIVPLQLMVQSLTWIYILNTNSTTDSVWNIVYTPVKIIIGLNSQTIQLMLPQLAIPVAARSKTWVCGQALAGIVGSNPTRGMDGCLLWVSVLSGRGLCDRPIPRPEEPYRMVCVVECDKVKNQKTLYTYCELVGSKGNDHKKIIWTSVNGRKLRRR